MKTVDIMEVFANSVEQKMFKEWRHEGFIGGFSSDHLNFVIDGKEYIVNIKEVQDGSHWSENT